MRWLIAFAAFAAIPGAIADEPAVIMLPTVEPVIVEPAPAEPQAVTELSADALYVVESDVQLFVLTSPQGVVNVAEDSGPMRIRGKFAGGTGRTETRTYSRPWIYTVEAATAGNVELVLVPRGVERADQIVRTTLNVVGLLPIPPPDVRPTPQPVDPPQPSTGLIQVVIIEETAERGNLPPEQLHAMLGESVRLYCKTHCSKSDGKTPDFRLLDDDLDVSQADKWIRDAFALPRTSLPWICVSNGKSGASQPLPGTADEVLRLLKKYGGE